MRGGTAISDTIKKVLMVPPRHFAVEYVINPWMRKCTVDKVNAMSQWSALKTSIEREGVNVLTLEQEKGLPDMVFVCNSGLVHDNKIFLSRFKNLERTGEQRHFAEFYRKLGYQLFGLDYPEVFEGGGDAVFSDSHTLWAGFGHRTSKRAYDHIRLMADDFDIVFCEMVNPNFYHLDTCFCPIGVDSALWYPPAFSKETQSEIKHRLPKAIAVTEGEANHFVCNAIAIRKKVISPPGVSPTTRQALAALGYAVDEVDMSEFMKSGGACQCLVMKL